MPAHGAEALIAELASAVVLLVAVSDRSMPGVHVVLTKSGATYLADTRDPDAPPSITRYAGSAATALRDGQPLPGTHAFTFDAATGVGAVLWWKDPDEYTNPDVPYVGTTRLTSRVLLVARLKDETTAGQARTMILLHELINALRDPRLDYPSLVAHVWAQSQRTGESQP